MTKFVGIDSGSSGAVAIIADDLVNVHPMQLEQEGKDTFINAVWLFGLLDREQQGGHKLVVVLEGAQKFTLGRLALASTWCAYGVLRTVLRILDVTPLVITPQAWQRTMLSSRRVTPEDTKAASVRAAQQIFPDVPLMRKPRSRVPDHNLADALLIAEWARRRNL